MKSQAAQRQRRKLDAEFKPGKGFVRVTIRDRTAVPNQSIQRPLCAGAVSSGFLQAGAQNEIEVADQVAAILLEVKRQRRLVAAPGIASQVLIALEVELCREGRVQKWQHLDVDEAQWHECLYRVVHLSNTLYFPLLEVHLYLRIFFDQLSIHLVQSYISFLHQNNEVKQYMLYGLDRTQ